MTPGQRVVKIVHARLSIRCAAGDGALKIDSPPAPILMVGHKAPVRPPPPKLAKRLKEKKARKSPLALDVYRPAAMDQLAVLGPDPASTPAIVKANPEYRQTRQTAGGAGGYDVYMSTPPVVCRSTKSLMKEVEDVRDVVSPRETLLVVDSLTSQVAVEVAGVRQQDRHLRRGPHPDGW